MSFTKLKKIHHYTDIVCIGLEVSQEKYQFSSSSKLLNIHGFNSIHLRPKNGTLHQFGEIITWDCDSLFDCICNYLPTNHNPILVVNHSLVAIGSSDFTQCLEQGTIVINRAERNNEDFGYEESGKQSTECFVASCPPTILMFTYVPTGKRYTMVDIANYGIDYISDVHDNLDDNDKKLIPNTAELGVSEDKSVTCTTLIARFMQELYKLVTKHELGGIGLTYSSIGMRCFRHSFYGDNILTHTNEEAIIVEKGMYLGGRVEERYHGHYSGKCYLLDIQSLYPHIGRSKPFPTELEDTVSSPPNRIIEERLKTHIIGALCHVDTPVPAYPVKIDGLLRFPVGQFNCYLCGEEFTDAYQEGRIKHVYHANFYKQGYILKEYSEYMLSLRTIYKKSSNKLSEMIVKLITNGLWGKFGQTGKVWVIDEREIADRAYGGYYKHNDANHLGEQYRIIDWTVSRLEHINFPDNVFSPISACMNSYSRHYIWRHMLQAGLHNVLYCCVDGLIVTQEGYDRLAWLIAPTPYQYGMYKVSETGDYANIYGYGKYAIGGKIASQGIPRKDSKQYSGFWSVLDRIDESIRPQILAGDTVAVTYKPSDIRNMLRNRCDGQGHFTAQDTVSQQIDSTLDHVSLLRQETFHSPEWLR
jgi:hypothetical protein